MKPTSLSPTILGGSLALAAVLVLSGCRFNPQAAQRIAERGSSGSRPGATAAALTEPTAAALAVTDASAAHSITAPTATARAGVPAPDTLPPAATAQAAATPVATPYSGTSAPAVSAGPAAPPAPTPAPIAVNGAVTSSAGLTTSTFIPAVNAGEPIAASPASAQSAAPEADTAADEIAVDVAVDVADEVADEAAEVLDPVVSADVNAPTVVAKRPKVTVRQPRVTAQRRVKRSVCTINTRAAVNLRRLPTTRSRRVAVLRPRTRFIAVARSSASRWVYGVSPRGRGWISAATVRCVPAPRALTVRR